MKCRHCGHTLRHRFLDLGNAPPSNAYLTERTVREPETWYPLRVLVCDACWLVQTKDFAGRDELFNDDYAYFSSFSTTWLAHAERYVREMIARFDLDASKRVVEVAANDGYLLQYVLKAGVDGYGIEPTASTAKAARDKGVDIVEAFFGEELADKLVDDGRQADLMVANNVLAHVPDINDFVRGFTRLLKPDGVATFEFPHLLKMVQGNQFDTAYHEHYSYLSFTAVKRIFEANGLVVFDVEELPTHGGSLRVFAQRRDYGAAAIAPAVADLLSKEETAGMTDVSFYQAFQHKAEQVKDDLVAYLIDAKRQGLKVAGYGAAAKGNTLLNFAGVRPDLLPYVVDKNPAKRGKFLPGSKIPIVDESRIVLDKPNLVLMLPWNIKTEIIAQLGYANQWGAVFVAAIPRLREFYSKI
ncbi:class I SAM-dependent methyltransferase [bacterium]|nr:class I SAM-dependent methyltransferase [bacterium]